MITLSKEQLDFLTNSYYKCNIVYGDNQSGKTFITILRFLKYIENEIPNNSLLCISSDTKINLRHLINKILSLNEGYIIKNDSLEIYFKNKNITIVPLYNGMSEHILGRKICGKVIKGWFGDNIESYTDNFITSIYLRLRDKDFKKMFFTYNENNLEEYFKNKTVFKNCSLDDSCLKVWNLKSN